jgi:hypothetical protein
MIPSLHLCCGNAIVSGDRCVQVSKHVYVRYLYLEASASVLACTSPMNMRKPCCHYYHMERDLEQGTRTGLKAVTFDFWF